MNGSLPPANSWQPAPGCQDTSSTSPSIAYGVTLTGVPAIIAATGAAGYVWSITLNDGNTPPDLTVDHYDSTGTLIDHPIVVSGDDGSTTFNDPVYLSRDPLAPLEAATKQYADEAAAAVVFPDAPSDGTNYVRNSGAWAPMGGPYYQTSGGYLSGAIGFNGPAQQRFIIGSTQSPANLARWQLNLGDTTTESGGAAGSNFTLTSYNDQGQQATTQLTITRTGQWIVPGAFQATGQIQLASPGNLQIGGGANGNVLTTNGLGALSWANPGSGGGVPEAPMDGVTYGRNSALWTPVPPDAPSNASTYGRSGGAWVVIPPPAIANDAPATSLYYARYNNGWLNIANGFLPLGGGTLTGFILINAAGANRAVAGQQSGSMRWAVYYGDTTAESGGNSGSNFAVQRYSDAGATIDTPLSISRATGLVSMPDGATVPTASPGDSSNLAASTAFVTAAVSGAGAAFVHKSGDTMTGNLAAPSLSASNGTSAPVAAASPLAGDNSTSLATTAWVNGRLGNYLPLAGGTLTGNLTAATFLTANSGFGVNGFSYGGASPVGFQWTQTGSTFFFDLFVGGTSPGYPTNLVWSQSSGGNTAIAGLNLNGNNSTMTAVYNGGSVAWTIVFSDRRLKTNIGDAGDALAALAAIPVHAFDMTNPFPGAEPAHWPFGLIADEVEPIIAQAAIAPIGEGGYASIRELPLVAALIKAVQQLKARVEALEQQVEASR